MDPSTGQRALLPMYSNGTPPSLVNPNRRPERPSRPTREMNIIKPPRRVESVLVNNLNAALASLAPNHPKPRASPALPSPAPSAMSFQSIESSYTSHYRSSISSNSSVGPYHTSQPELSPRYRLYDDSETMQKPRSLPGEKRKPAPRATIPLGRTSHRESHLHPTIHITDPRSFAPRPSFDSTLSTDSGRSWIDLKERKLPPPPLQLDDSNLRPKKHHKNPMVEVLAPGPPRVESRLSSYSIDPASPPPPTPGTPAPPSEEEIRRRRHDKVMQMLGERVPPELVYRGRKIPNVTTFPDPPMPQDVAPTEAGSSKLTRRSSFTLLSFPNISSVTPTLRSTNHSRNKSRDLLERSDSPSPSTSTPRASTPQPFASALTPTPVSSTPTPLTFPHRNPRSNQRAAYPSSSRNRPESAYSPIIFAESLEKTPTQSFRALAVPEDDDDLHLHPMSTTPDEKEAERLAKLARRASLSTTTFLPSSPMRDGFRDVVVKETPAFLERKPRRPEPSSPESIGGLIDVVQVNGRPRPESMIASPLVFARHISLMPPSDGFKLLVEDKSEDWEESDEEDSVTAGSRTPPYRELRIQPDLSHGMSESEPHLPSTVRPDAPFQNSGIPLDSYLSPPSSWKRSNGKDLIQRKERRQGWSGEWNQEDMQDVIKKLRNLK